MKLENIFKYQRYVVKILYRGKCALNIGGYFALKLNHFKDLMHCFSAGKSG